MGKLDNIKSYVSARQDGTERGPISRDDLLWTINDVVLVFPRGEVKENVHVGFEQVSLVWCM